MKLTKLQAIRLVGAMLAAVGWILWYRGGSELLRVDWHGIEFSPRLDYVLVVGGMIVLLAPEFVVMLLAAIVPERVQSAVLSWLGSAQSEAAANVNRDGKALSTVIDDFIERVDKRYYRTVFGILIFVTVLLPILVIDRIAIAKFQEQRSVLINLVQETRIDFGAADTFRGQLARSRDVMESYTARDSATVKLYLILYELYDGVKDSDDFRKRMGSLFAREVRGFQDPGTGILDEKIYSQPFDKRLDSAEAAATLMGLLAFLSEFHGEQGEFLDPYIATRQLASAACKIPGVQNSRLPAAHNLMGLGYSGCLKRYNDYVARFSSGSAANYERILGESKPLRWFELAQVAEREFTRALADSDRFYSQARYLNNSADLQLSLLKWMHLEETNLQFKSSDETKFLLENTGIVSKTRGVDSARLVEIFDDLKKKLDRATNLSRQPPIFFTRAQMYSLGGELAEKYSIAKTRWSDQGWCRRQVMDNLRTARSLGLEATYFEKAKISALGLEWLLKDQKFDAELAALASNEEYHAQQ